MSKYISKLLSISSNSISQSEVMLPQKILKLAGDLGDELLCILHARNGFFAFMSALHFFPSDTVKDSIGLVEWNESSLWKNRYPSSVADALFFAEDIFGGQFCVKDNVICYFDPETGDIDEMASNFDSWAKKILDDYGFWTGYSLAFEWQNTRGKLSQNMRLLPTIPFVLGGSFEVNNLKAVDSIEGMRFRASLACNLVNVSDNTRIELKVTE